MKNILKNRYVCLSLAIMCAICGAGLFIFLLFNIFNLVDLAKTILKLLTPILVGFFIAYFLSPVQNGLEENLLSPLFMRPGAGKDERKAKKRMRLFSTILTTLIFFVSVGILLSMIVPEVIRSITTIVNNSPEYVDRVNLWIAQAFANNPGLERTIREYVDKAGTSINSWMSDKVVSQIGQTIKTVTSQVFGILRLFLDMVIGLIVSVYMLYSKEEFQAQATKIVYAFFKKKTAQIIFREAQMIHRTFGGFLTGKVIDSIIIGLLCFAACSVLNMPYTVLVSVIVGVTNIIPFVGPFIGAIPSALIILLVSPKQALYFVIVIFILQQLDGNIIGPKILGNSTGLSAFWVIFAITLFGGLFGFFGMFLGVPIFAVFYNMFSRLTARKLGFRRMPQNTEAYISPETVKENLRLMQEKRREREAVRTGKGEQASGAKKDTD